MSFDRKFLVWALCYAVAGMCLGIFMAASHDHGQFVTHAHIMLAGFVVSFIYGVIHKLWLGANPHRLAGTQFIIHQVGALIMFTGLFLLYGGIVPEPKVEPFLAVSTFVVLIGALLMLFMVFKSNTAHA